MAGANTTEVLQQERDAFREKFEHMKILVKELQQENQMLKIRREGVETVTQLLQECRQENSVLQKQKSILNTAVQNLQNRLASNQLPVDPVCEEGEVIIPGTSKELLDNLARENSRLRSAIQNLSTQDPVEKEKQQQLLDSLQQRVSALERERDDLKQMNKELEAAISGSECEKAHHLILYQGKLEQMQRDAKTQDVLCHSLSEEITTLRNTLRQFSRQSLDMELKLKKFEESTVKERSMAPSPSPQPNSQDQTDSNILLEEKKKLEKSLNEALLNNHRWQEYNNSREKFVQDLKMKNEELEARFKRCQSGEINSLLATAKQKMNQAQEEIRDLNRRLEAERRWREERENEVALLRRQVSTASSAVSDEGTLDALRAQVQTCTEDFEMERRDREKAQQRVGELESELESARKEMQRYGISNPGPQMAQRYPVPATPERGYVTQDFNRYGPVSQTLASRGLQSIGVDGGAIRHSRSTPEGLVRRDQEAFPVSLPLHPSQRGGEKTNSGFTCPTCGKAFPEDKHRELMQHMDDCWTK